MVALVYIRAGCGMKKVKPVLISVLIFTFAFAGFYLYRHYYSSKPVQLEASGTIEATSVDLKAKTSGTIRDLTLKEGDRIAPGQVAAILERNDLLAQKERDAMSVLSAEARLNQLLSGARDEEIKAALASVNLAQANLNQAARDLERTRILYQNGAIAPDQLEQAETGYKVLEETLAIAQTKLDLLNAGSRAEEIDAAAAEVERAKAVLKASEALLEDLKIISPIEGTVASKNYELGEFVSAGSSLLSVANLRDLWIKVYIPTDDLPRIRLQQEVAVTVSGSSQVFPGRVIEIASKGEYTPKSIQTKKERANVVFAVKIAVENIDDILKPGMPADVTFNRSI